jgi:hypothetical protein
MTTILRRALSLVLLAACFAFGERRAWADGESATPPASTQERDHDLTKLRLGIDQLGADAKERRYDRATMLGVIGAGALGSAVALDLTAKGPRNALRPAGDVMIGVAITSGSLAIAYRWLAEDPQEDMREVVALAVARGGSSDETIAAIEAAWKERAAREHTRRLVVGGLAMGIGLALAVAGAAVPELAPASQQGRTLDSVGSALVGAGSCVLVLGAEALFRPTGIESSYATYHALHGGGAGDLRVGAAPLPGGGTFQLSGSF